MLSDFANYAENLSPADPDTYFYKFCPVWCEDMEKVWQSWCSRAFLSGSQFTRTNVTLLGQGSVHSGFAGWNDCRPAFRDKLRVSSFPRWKLICPVYNLKKPLHTRRRGWTIYWTRCPLRLWMYADLEKGFWLIQKKTADPTATWASQDYCKPSSSFRCNILHKVCAKRDVEV